jgi:DNA polymerase III alpha subunit (gram-positive type)
MFYLVMDTETGGLDPQRTSLLTAYFSVLDENLDLVDSFDMKLRQDVYHVTAAALEINHINLIELHHQGEEIDKVTNKLNQFLRKYAVTGEDSCEPLVPVGQNIAFDLQGLKMRLPDVRWNKYVSYRVLDTQVIARFLQMQGKLPADLKCSLRSLASYFGVKDNAAHTADGDVLVTTEVLKFLLGVK